MQASSIESRIKKKPNDWLRLPDTALCDALIKENQKGMIRDYPKCNGWMKQEEQFKNYFTKVRWLHPKLAVRFAQ